MLYRLQILLTYGNSLTLMSFSDLARARHLHVSLSNKLEPPWEPLLQSPPACLLIEYPANKTLHNLFCIMSWNYAHGIVHCFLLEQILSCPVRTRPDWIDWYFQTIARVKNRSSFRIMAVTVGGAEYCRVLQSITEYYRVLHYNGRNHGRRGIFIFT